MKETRQRLLSPVRSLVIKLGTQLLADAQKKLDAAFLAQIARQVMILRGRGVRVTLVSSGAIGAGLRELNLAKRPADLARLQAVAAVGQRKLMDAWGDAFEPYKLPVAQLLLTREDIEDRTRFLNVRNTINAVHELGGVPIINENDTISTDELIRISFGDNDILAALVCQALRANLLVLLTVVDGLLDEKGQPVRLVPCIDEARKLVRREKSAMGKGGMDSKLEAANMVSGAGDILVVANGRLPDILPRLLDGEVLGTLFMPSPRKRHLRSRWIGSVRPVGAVVIDAGAVKALVEKNKSLLPAGVIQVQGPFDHGDCIAVKDPDGAFIARGLSNYSSEDVERLRGKKTSEIRALLDDAVYDEVIHRDNLVLG